jgi:hypothetical protein
LFQIEGLRLRSNVLDRHAVFFLFGDVRLSVPHSSGSQEPSMPLSQLPLPGTGRILVWLPMTRSL